MITTQDPFVELGYIINLLKLSKNARVYTLHLWYFSYALQDYISRRRQAEWTVDEIGSALTTSVCLQTWLPQRSVIKIPSLLCDKTLNFRDHSNEYK